MLLEYIAVFAALKPTYAVIFGGATLVVHLLALVAIVMGRGSARHKLVWIAVILLLPLAGVILYLGCGRNDADRPLLE